MNVCQPSQLFLQIDCILVTLSVIRSLSVHKIIQTAQVMSLNREEHSTFNTSNMHQYTSVLPTCILKQQNTMFLTNLKCLDPYWHIHWVKDSSGAILTENISLRQQIGLWIDSLIDWFIENRVQSVNYWLTHYFLIDNDSLLTDRFMTILTYSLA